jgi:hypothetical protein
VDSAAGDRCLDVRTATQIGDELLLELLQTLPAADAGVIAESRPAAVDATPGVVATAAPALPSQSPRFAWKAPLSVPVEEEVAKSGQRVSLRYRIDVCPGKGGLLRVDHRDMRIARVNDVPMNQDTAGVEQLEATLAAMPTILVNAKGDFVDATGYTKMLDRLASAYPKQDFSAVRRVLATPNGAATFKQELANRWQVWIEAWLAFDPQRGSPQQGSDADGTTPLTFRYDGRSSVDRVRLSARRSLPDDEAKALLSNMGKAMGVSDLDLGSAVSEVTFSLQVETDWPELRPWAATSRTAMRMRVKGEERQLTEQHEYRFNWAAATSEPSRCR